MEEENKIIIKATVQLNKIFSPKNTVVKEGESAIFTANIINCEEGKPKINKWGTIKLMGQTCGLEYGKQYNIIAEENYDEKWGYQYKLLFMSTKTDFSNKENQRAFLEMILTETQCNNLFNAFNNPIDILKKGDIKRLCEVKGIGKVTGEKLMAKYNANKDNAKAYIELGKYGLTQNAINKLINTYGSPNTAISKVKENPYILIDEVDGFGWEKCDKLALSSGIGKHSKFRVIAFIKNYLKQETYNGNTWSYVDDLWDTIDSVLGRDLPEKVIVKSLQDMEKKDILWTNSDRDKVALKKYYNLENNICKELIRINESKNNFNITGWEEKVKKQEEKQGWKFTDEQLEGIKATLENQVVLIIGSAGTGKSATVSGMLSVLDKNSFVQTALSGRASGNLTDVTGEEGYTIHRLLNVDPITKKFLYNKNNPLDIDEVIVDEQSMIGEEIFYSLIQAIPNGTKLVMLGDIKQLEAIGIGNLLKDMIQSGVIKVVELTKIHRQAEDSGIITESLKASEKIQWVDKNFEGIEVRGKLQDMMLDIYKDRELTSKKMINHFKELLLKGVDKNDIQLIVPKKDKGKASAYSLSNEIQKIVTDMKGDYIEIGAKSDTPRKLFVGDRIINMKNNYKIISAKDENKTIPIFNGDLGIITKINKNARTINVKFNNKEEVVIPSKHLIEIFLGYCISTHKLQGSNAPYVICGLDYSHGILLLTKEMVYTMPTRAKKYCVFCAENKALRKAISTSNVKQKRTFLCDLLKQAYEDIEEYKKTIKPTERPIFEINEISQNEKVEEFNANTQAYWDKVYGKIHQ